MILHVCSSFFNYFSNSGKIKKTMEVDSDCLLSDSSMISCNCGMIAEDGWAHAGMRLKRDSVLKRNTRVRWIRNMFLRFLGGFVLVLLELKFGSMSSNPYLPKPDLNRWPCKSALFSFLFYLWIGFRFELGSLYFLFLRVGLTLIVSGRIVAFVKRAQVWSIFQRKIKSIIWAEKSKIVHMCSFFNIKE